MKYLKKKKIVSLDILAIIAIVLGGIFFYINIQNIHLSFDKKIDIQGAWLATTADNGYTYVVDSDRARILVVNQNQEVIQMIKSDSNKANSFRYIDDLEVDSEGNIYILDTHWKANSFLVSGDYVYQYDSKGNYIRTVFSKTYEQATKHQMFGLTIKEDKIQVVCAEDNEVALWEIDKNLKATQLVAYTYKEAITMLQDIAICSSNNDLYAIDKRGTIVKFSSDHQQASTFYDWSKLFQNEKQVALYRLDVTSTGVVYVTDIASEQLLRIEKGKEETVAKDIGIYNVSLHQDSNELKIGYTTAGNFKTITQDGKIYLEGSQLNYSLQKWIIHIIEIISIIIMGLFLLWLVLRAFLLISSIKFSFVQKISGIVFSSVAIVVIIVMFQLIGNFKDILRVEKLENIQTIARNISSSLDKNAIEGITKTTDYMNDDFRKIVNTMDEFINYDHSDSMYCNIVKYSEALDDVYDIAFLDSSIGAYYPLNGNEAKEIIDVYRTGDTISSDSVTENGGFTYVKVPVKTSDNQVIAVVEVGTWGYVIDNQINEVIRKMLISLVVLLVMVIFVFSEIFECVNLRMEFQKEKKKNEKAFPFHLGRGLVCIVFMAYNLPTAFLPVYVASMYNDKYGLPSEIAASLPISINLALLGIMALFGPKLARKFGFRRVMAASALITMVGDLIMALAGNYVMIIIGLIFNGIGVGLQMNLLHMNISSVAEETGDNRIFTMFNAGSLSGIMIGMALGAIMADGLGYRKVFLVTTGIWVVVAIITLIFSSQIAVAISTVKNDLEKKKSFSTFLFSKKILSFLLFIQFTYVIISSFVYYYVPIYCDENGMGSNISCLFIMLSSICGIYLSSAMTGYFMKKIKSGALYLSSAIALLALLFFGFFPGTITMIITLILIGFANSFGSSSRTAVFSDLPQTQAYGPDKAMGVYDFVDRSAEAVGPMIFSSLLAGDFLSGIIKFIGISSIANIGYFIINKIKK